MNIEAINHIVKLATETALTFYKEQVENEKSRVLDKRLKNTKLLLKNYRYLKQHTDSIRLEIDELNEILILDEINNNHVEIESIKKSKRRTMIMLKYVEKMLEIYQAVNEKRHYILVSTYINENKMSVKDLASFYQVTPRAIYKEINISINELSSLLWGIESLDFL